MHTHTHLREREGEVRSVDLVAHMECQKGGGELNRVTTYLKLDRSYKITEALNWYYHAPRIILSDFPKDLQLHANCFIFYRRGKFGARTANRFVVKKERKKEIEMGAGGAEDRCGQSLPSVSVHRSGWREAACEAVARR